MSLYNIYNIGIRKWCLLLLCCIGLAAAESPLAVVQFHVNDPKAQADHNTSLKRLCRYLDRLGLEKRLMTEDELTAKALEGVSLVLWPSDKSPQPVVMKELATFVENGGQLGLFYVSHGPLLKLLDIDSVTYVGGKDLGTMTGFRFPQGGLEGAPLIVNHGTRNIMEANPAPKGKAKAVGQVVGENGKVLKRRGLMLHPNGFYFPHVLLEQDKEGTGRLLLALLGRSVPKLWETAVRHRMEEVGQLASAKDLQELKALLEPLHHKEADALLAAAEKNVAEGARQLSLKHNVQAMERVETAAEEALQAYMKTRSSRKGELRGVWIHSAYGIRDWGWDKTVKVLAENGFNAIFPNMLWGYAAEYRSEVLPVHPDVETRGDQLELCLAACRKYGVECHVWKVCWNMGHRTPADKKREMTAAGRTQVTDEGAPSEFLAPHLQANLDLEVAALLEVVKKYRVDGVHLDYVRYPNEHCDFSESARHAFEEVLGKPVEKWPADCLEEGVLYEEYTAWRQGNINRLVEQVHETLKAAREDIKISAAVYGDWKKAEHTVAQCAQTWVENQWLDFICPMNYSDKAEEMAGWLRSQLLVAGGKLPLYTGLGTWLQANPAVTAEQIELARKTGADGFICFEHRLPFADRFLPALHEGVTSLPAGKLLPHHSPPLKFMLLSKPVERPPVKKSQVIDNKEDKNNPFDEIQPPALKTGSMVEWRVEFPSLGRLPANGLKLRVLKNGLPFGTAGTVKSRRQGNGLRCHFVSDAPGVYQLEAYHPHYGMLRRSQPVELIR